MKLVTPHRCRLVDRFTYFNPHEREARDWKPEIDMKAWKILIHTSVKLVTRRLSYVICPCSHFNPHEREARDCAVNGTCQQHVILIHTSVKLVTLWAMECGFNLHILIHTSVKLVTDHGDDY